MTAQLYTYRWDRQGRKGQTCQVTARGKFNSIRVVFADGYTMITSGNAIRKRPEPYLTEDLRWQPIWANAEDYLKIDIVDGKAGPWGHLYSPVNEAINGRNPVDMLLLKGRDDEVFVPAALASPADVKP